MKATDDRYSDIDRMQLAASERLEAMRERAELAEAEVERLRAALQTELLMSNASCVYGIHGCTYNANMHPTHTGEHCPLRDRPTSARPGDPNAE